MSDLNHVVARFYVQRMEKFAGQGSNRTFHLVPVTRGPENKKWAAATPTGSIQIGVGNPEAADWFESMLGKDLAITFEARPLICTECHGEIATEFQYDNQSFIPYEDGSVKHRVCPTDN